VKTALWSRLPLCSLRQSRLLPTDWSISWDKFNPACWVRVEGEQRESSWCAVCWCAGVLCCSECRTSIISHRFGIYLLLLGSEEAFEHKFSVFFLWLLQITNDVDACCNSAFAYVDWGKPWKITVRIVGPGFESCTCALRTSEIVLFMPLPILVLTSDETAHAVESLLVLYSGLTMLPFCQTHMCFRVNFMT